MSVIQSYISSTTRDVSVCPFKSTLDMSIIREGRIRRIRCVCAAWPEDVAVSP